MEQDEDEFFPDGDSEQNDGSDGDSEQNDGSDSDSEQNDGSDLEDEIIAPPSGGSLYHANQINNRDNGGEYIMYGVQLSIFNINTSGHIMHRNTIFVYDEDDLCFIIFENNQEILRIYPYPDINYDDEDIPPQEIINQANNYVRTFFRKSRNTLFLRPMHAENLRYLIMFRNNDDLDDFLINIYPSSINEYIDMNILQPRYEQLMDPNTNEFMI
jgi:hypothetical protein